MMTQALRLLSVAAIVASVGLTAGCTTLKNRVADSSLDYSKTKKLDPIALPADAQTLPFTPLYQVPESGTNTLTLTDKDSKRFALPPPVRSVK